MVDNGYGELAGALAKAQASFPPIQRDKEVTVQTKAGGSYKFKYAPLDSILAAVRAPLADNGLAIVQLLDEDVLVTSLLHSSGAILSGRTPIPQTEGVQAYGSAITYLRRYSIQALLGIAAEEDDDGNQAAGNAATFRSRPPAGTVAPPVLERVEMTGILSIGESTASDGKLRETPTGWALGFNLTTGPRQWIRVTVVDDMALAIAQDNVNLRPGLPLKVWGPIETLEDHLKDRTIKFRRITVERIVADEWEYPAPEPAAAEVQPPLSEDDEAELDALVLPLGQS